MPRPKTVSDEDVLAAALEVLAEKGHAFTLTDMANRIGLSRATLIQRFGDRDAILLRIAAYEVELARQWIGSIEIVPGRDGLWQFLETIVASMGEGDEFSARVTLASLEARSPALRQLGQQRYALVQTAIAARLPVGPNRDRTAEHVHTIIAGASMQWVVSDRATGLSDFVLDQLRWTLKHLPSDFT